MDLKMAKRFLELHHKRKALEAEVETIKKEMTRLDPMILEDMANEGVTRISLDGWNLGTKRSLLVSPINSGDKPAQCRALIAAGYKDLVSVGFNINSLSAEYRELEKNEALDSLPDIMKATFKTFEKFAVNITKEGAKR